MGNIYGHDTAEKAVEKLKEERKKVVGNKESVMASAVLEALISFCGQDEEFAQAVIDKSQTFADCMKAVAAGVGSSISDVEAFGKAVQFYFPGAAIEVKMTVHVNPHDADPQDTQDMILDVMDLL